jgi:hypothetical protein
MITIDEAEIRGMLVTLTFTCDLDQAIGLLRFLNSDTRVKTEIIPIIEETAENLKCWHEIFMRDLGRLGLKIRTYNAMTRGMGILTRKYICNEEKGKEELVEVDPYLPDDWPFRDSEGRLLTLDQCLHKVATDPSLKNWLLCIRNFGETAYQDLLAKAQEREETR